MLAMQLGRTSWDQAWMAFDCTWQKFPGFSATFYCAPVAWALLWVSYTAGCRAASAVVDTVNSAVVDNWM